VKLLYIMVTNNVDHEQEIELEVVTKSSPDFSVTVEMPPVGTESSEVPGTTRRVVVRRVNLSIIPPDGVGLQPRFRGRRIDVAETV
jgi:hypothetical protein